MKNHSGRRAATRQDSFASISISSTTATPRMNPGGDEGRCAGGRVDGRPGGQAKPINSAEDDDDFIAFEGPTLNLAPTREIEPGRFTIIMSCSADARTGHEIQAPTQFLLCIPQDGGGRGGDLHFIPGEVTFNSAQPEVPVRGAPSLPQSSSALNPHSLASECRMLARDRRLLATKTHTEKEKQRGGERRTGQERGWRLRAHPRHDRRFVTLLL